MAGVMDFLFKRWAAFTRFLEDGRVYLSNAAAAERALRGIAVGRRNWTFAGSDAGGRAARGGAVHADRDRQAQRGRSPGLAGRRAGPTAGPSRAPDRRTPPLELDTAPAIPECRLTSRARNDARRAAVAERVR
jgi:hypothetical protein